MSFLLPKHKHIWNFFHGMRLQRGKSTAASTREENWEWGAFFSNAEGRQRKNYKERGTTFTMPCPPCANLTTKSANVFLGCRMRGVGRRKPSWMPSLPRGKVWVDQGPQSQYVRATLWLFKSPCCKWCGGHCLWRNCTKENFPLREVSVRQSSVVAAFLEALSNNKALDQKKRCFKLKCLEAWRENYKPQWWIPSKPRL